MSIKSNIERLGSKVFSSYVITFGIEFLIMVISVMLFKIIAVRFSGLGFAEFTINKRIVGFLMPLMMMGMGVSLPKFLPNENERKQLEIHYSSLMIISFLFLFALALFFFMSAYLSKLAFGDYNHEKMCVASLLYVYSLMAHACLYNFFRGKFDFFISSLLQLANLGIFPLIACFFVHDIFQYLVVLSFLSFTLLLFINIRYIPFARFSFNEYSSTIKRIVRYGIQRMPGDVFLGLFLAVPAFIASNYFSITEAGNIAFCLSLFNIVIALMSPVNIILLPKASKIVHEKNFSLLKEISNKLLFLSIGIGLITLAIVYFFGQTVLMLFSVKDHLDAGIYLNLIFVGVVGYSLFSVIRSIIDAYYEKARVTSIIIIAFILFLILIGMIKYLDALSIRNILISFSISINILGLLTFFSLTRIYKTIRK
jgi:O-antigen/teichoic acid export membrane protein